MASYVYQVKVECHPADAPLYPQVVDDMSRETILYKCQRKAEKFVIKTIKTWCSDDQYNVWQPEPQTWHIDSSKYSARCTVRILEIKVRT